MFAGLGGIEAVDRHGRRLAASLLTGAVDVTVPVYLGTYTMRFAEEPASSLSVSVKAEGGVSGLFDSRNNPIPFDAPSTTVTFGKPAAREIGR